MNAARAWPIAIVAVLAITVAANVALFIAAGDRDAAVAEPDYYRRAVAWDTTLAAARATAALGWAVDVDATRDAAGGARLSIAANDSAGRAIAGAAVEVTALHSRPPMRVVHGRDTLDTSGRVAMDLPLDRPGLWEIRLDVRRGGERWVGATRRDLGARP